MSDEQKRLRRVYRALKTSELETILTWARSTEIEKQVARTVIRERARFAALPDKEKKERRSAAKHRGKRRL